MIGLGVELLVHGDQTTLTVVTWIERFVYVGIFVILGSNVLRTLYRGEKNGNATTFLAAFAL